MKFHAVSGLGLVCIAFASCTAIVPPQTPAGVAPAWVEPSAKSASQLLYVSDVGTFDVYVYRYPSLELAARLHGFRDPQGECADASGNVWIADTQSAQMIEYAHGGSKPIAKLADPLGYPAGCAVDAATGDLAVTNLYGFSGAGSVLVYKNARGTPKVYANPNLYYDYFAGYDRNGDLYVSGATSSHGYLLAVLPHGSNSMELVKIDGGELYFPGTVVWLGSTLVLGDQRCKSRMTSCLYELRVSGRSARVTGTTPLNGSCDVVQAWVDSTQIVGGDDAAYCRKRRSTVDVWTYPGGGNPHSSISGPRMPIGAVLSVRQSR